MSMIENYVLSSFFSVVHLLKYGHAFSSQLLKPHVSFQLFLPCFSFQLFITSYSFQLSHFKLFCTANSWQLGKKGLILSTLGGSGQQSPTTPLPVCLLQCVYVTIHISFKLAKGNLKAPFCLAATLRCTGGCYSFLWISPLYSWSVLYNAES